jgi:hypothetical protein
MAGGVKAHEVSSTAHTSASLAYAGVKCKDTTLIQSFSCTLGAVFAVFLLHVSSPSVHKMLQDKTAAHTCQVPQVLPAFQPRTRWLGNVHLAESCTLSNHLLVGYMLRLPHSAHCARHAQPGYSAAMVPEAPQQ